MDTLGPAILFQNFSLRTGMKRKGISTRQRLEKTCNSCTGCIATEMLEVTNNRFQSAMRAMTHDELMKSADHYHDIVVATAS